MLGAYGWAFVKPIRKLYYNLTITAVSVVVAVIVGGLETLNLIGDQLGLTDGGGFWGAIGSLNDNFGLLGYRDRRRLRRRLGDLLRRLSAQALRRHRGLGGLIDGPASSSISAFPIAPSPQPSGSNRSRETGSTGVSRPPEVSIKSASTCDEAGCKPWAARQFAVVQQKLLQSDAVSSSSRAKGSPY